VIIRKKNIDETKINMKLVQEVSNDITTLIKFTSIIKINSAKIQNLTKKIDQDTDEINDAVNLYKDKLRSAKSSSVNTTDDSPVAFHHPDSEDIFQRELTLHHFTQFRNFQSYMVIH
jgi:thiamine biosynthesis lipoprotein ApbE